MSVTPQDIITYWLDEVTPARWFKVDTSLDDDIREHFIARWRDARDGNLDAWMQNAEGSLALLILLDQFPRNMFRGQAEAFSTDAKAREVTRRAIDKGFDMAVRKDARALFYLPLMHSENLADQDLCVKLIGERLGEDSLNYPFALGHREEIRQFGRFAGRNAALGRNTTDAEQAFLDKRAAH